ncbi:MAG: argininosuccinate lyase [Bacilli bacterium]|nr:argininosuccinate lyase [Bacilli bacterium]
MEKLWSGRTKGATSEIADSFNSSITFDSRLYSEDIEGSIAHAMMLAHQGIISEEEKEEIVNGLISIKDDIFTNSIKIDMSAEDIHMFIESELTKRIGEAGKKLHTARSRNDQVALDTRLHLLKKIKLIKHSLKKLIKSLVKKAENHVSTIMPGYTHLQRAQPISFAHLLLAYVAMLDRDIDRLDDLKKRVGVSPIGACALAGTTYDTDRFYEAELLGLDKVSVNSLDAVSDRDFVVEFLADASLIMMHLSRMSEEFIIYSSWEFKFIEFSDEFTTGSSIMPQKKNSDMAELIRGKTGRVYGDLISLLVTLKGLPLAYNKDMQEDKEAMFDAIDTLEACLKVMTPMIDTMKVFEDNMLLAAQKGFINATDLADYLVSKGLPFREAYKVSGSLVGDCIKNNTILEKMNLTEFKAFSPLIEDDVYEAISLTTCLNKRNSYGGTSPKNVMMQIELYKKRYK